jgi:nucleotide-binding universal stress UspA family protein
MKILLAADGSPHTRIAARQLAAHLAWFAKVPEVHVVHVQPPIPYPRAAAIAGKAAVEKYQREESETALAVAESELGKAGIPYRSSWRVGEVAPALQDYVKANDIELVVMGSHGKGALANLALGSVATKCIATLEVPVMIVRLAPPQKPRAKSAASAARVPSKATP